jgi:hypothetical protein
MGRREGNLESGLDPTENALQAESRLDNTQIALIEDV